ncbi:hypothetical protein [Priestia taiwanensis]|uniref:Uncharacterized protein n=1 Tax=Priestia taiwanensis TaxID=1347902 RepID=A0A917ATD3_9BACI|nr:hypothetical protein [Priestia taiwanensis]MBM7364091.1 hypothetical protein [Priestia taiwanensis]GGE71543.1 hypothetical protein GCM10007140_21840 [Priestia taiwanensis]
MKRLKSLKWELIIFFLSFLYNGSLLTSKLLAGHTFDWLRALLTLASFGLFIMSVQDIKKQKKYQTK